MDKLQRKIHMPYPLMNAARTDNIHAASGPTLKILLCQSPAHLHQNAALPLIIPQPLHSRRNVFGPEVIQHDHIRARLNSLERLGCRLTFDFDLDGEAANSARSGDCARDRAGRPDVVVFEHGHGAEIVTVRVAATNKHAVFFDKAEARRGLARASEGAVVAG